MSTPIRIQRKRIKGWRMPPNTVSVTRPGKWGNPFRIGGYFRVGAGAFAWLEAIAAVARNDPRFRKIETAEEAVEFYRRYATERKPGTYEPLRGKNLACFCPLDKPCHADVLLELANAKEEPASVTESSVCQGASLSHDPNRRGAT